MKKILILLILIGCLSQTTKSVEAVGSFTSIALIISPTSIAPIVTYIPTVGDLLYFETKNGRGQVTGKLIQHLKEIRDNSFISEFEMIEGNTTWKFTATFSPALNFSQRFNGFLEVEEKHFRVRYLNSHRDIPSLFINAGRSDAVFAMQGNSTAFPGLISLSGEGSYRLVCISRINWKPPPEWGSPWPSENERDF